MKVQARWHKFRHVCRSGPYYLENPELPETADVDHFSVKKYSDKEVSKPKRPTIESVMDLSVHYFPVELTSKRQRDESSHRATQEKGLDSSWSARVLNQAEEEYTKFEEAAKKAENDKKADSDEEGNELPEDRAEDEYSQDDYQQGEYFDDDEGYDEYEDAGDEGPVY